MVNPFKDKVFPDELHTSHIIRRYEYVRIPRQD